MLPQRDPGANVHCQKQVLVLHQEYDGVQQVDS